MEKVIADHTKLAEEMICGLRAMQVKAKSRLLADQFGREICIIENWKRALPRLRETSETFDGSLS